MSDPQQTPTPSEPDTESCEQVEDEAPTEEHESTASETQASELATVELLANEIEELRSKAAERDEFLDKLQRSKADFINYQKRLQRERERWSEMAVQDFALRLLPVLDDLARALEAARQDHDVEALTRGIQLIQSNLLKALGEHAVTPFEALGEQFDPAFHEGVAHREEPNAPDQSVVEVLQRGYMIGGRVLRPAQVVVGKGGPTPEEPAAPAQDNEGNRDSEE